MEYDILKWGLQFGALILGGVIVRFPKETISFQIRFYQLINWKIEPVDYNKEVRNTRWMGFFLLLFVLATVVYDCLTKG